MQTARPTAAHLAATLADRVQMGVITARDHRRDLGADAHLLPASIVVGVLVDLAITDEPVSTTAEPVVFTDRHLAHVVRCILQATHDLAGYVGLVDQGDALDFVLAESSDDAEGVVIATRLVHGQSVSIDSLDHADGLSAAEIAAAACGACL